MDRNTRPTRRLAVAVVVGVAAYLFFLRQERNREPDRVAEDVSETIIEAGAAGSEAHPTGYAMAHHQYALQLYKNSQLERAQQLAVIAAETGPIEEELFLALSINEEGLDAPSTTDHQEVDPMVIELYFPSRTVLPTIQELLINTRPP
jgi:hypothetical protein